ncbi:MAG: hypothetical protein AAFU81_01555 [Pseudomonadota bacterium]
MTVSTYAKNLMLANFPDTVYVALFAGGAPGVGTEVTPATLWGSGNRPAMTLGAAVAGVRDPDGDASIGTIDVASQEVTHIALYDADTGGNLLQHEAFARTLYAGDPVSWPDANAVISLIEPA